MKFRFHPFGVLLPGGICCAFLFARAGDNAVPKAGDDDAVPKGYPVERYEVLWEHSPFTMVSTAVAPQAGFAQNLAVAGIAKIGDDNLVTLVNTKSLERMTIDAEADAQGMKVVAVVTDPDPLKTKVTIQKGSEVATVSFDKTLLAMTQTPDPLLQGQGNPASSGTQNPAATGGQGGAPMGGAPAPKVVLRLQPIPGASPSPAHHGMPDPRGPTFPN